MDDKPFRVLLDARGLFLEPFNRIWLCITPKETRSISDLKSVIRKKLNLPTKKFHLYVRDGLLLDEETIAVLRDDDIVRVEYNGKSKISSPEKSKSLSHEKGKVSSHEKSSSKEKEHKRHKSDEINIKDKTLKVKKRKKCQEEDNDFNEHEKQIETEFSHKIKKHKKNQGGDNSNYNKEPEAKDTNTHATDASLRNYNTDSNTGDVKKKHCKRKDKYNSLSFDHFNVVEVNKHQNVCYATISDSAVAGISGGSLPKKHKGEKSGKINESWDSVKKIDSERLAIKERSAQSNLISPNANAVQVVLDEGKTDSVLSKNTPKKKKRKRKRKRKDKLLEVVVPLDTPHVDVCEVSTAALCSDRKHVIFSPPKQQEGSFCDDILGFDSSVAKNSSDNDSKPCRALQAPLFKDKLPLSATASTYLKKENKNLVCDASALKIKSVTSLSPKASALLKETLEDSKLSERSTAKEICNDVNNSTQLEYNDLPPLSCLPKVGTKIAYKVLELDENYSPVVSHFREGIVKEINKKTDEMVIELVKHIIKPGRIGKFELLKELEVPPPDIIREETLFWNALIEPKLLT